MTPPDKAESKRASKLTAKSRFINRELSWLAFNGRVLEEALNTANPLLERVNFLSISGSNLDEFYMVRVAGLMDQILFNVSSPSVDGLTAEQQLKQIRQQCGALIQTQQKCWNALMEELKDQGISVVTKEGLALEEQQWLHEYFLENLFPVLTPIAIDPAHPFPFIPNRGMAQLFRLRDTVSGKGQVAIILFPTNMRRFVRLPKSRGKQKQRLIMVEEVIELFLDALFPDFVSIQSGVVRVIRDSDLDVGDDAEDLVRYFERAIKRRRRGRVVRVMTNGDMPEELLKTLIGHLQIDERDVIREAGMVGLSHLSELVKIARPELKFTPFNVRFPERIQDFEGDCFAAIEAKDIVVHHPYESFDVVVQFLKQAATDPDVVSIKLTLYRTSTKSPIIAALIDAAESGKSVTAVVELKARFDEEANIKWARDLERAGVQVVYGFVKLKTHAKVTLVARRSEDGLQSFVHYGTGNYHPSTAKVYTDLSFFTSNEVLCRDAAYFFNFVTGYAQPRDMQQLTVAPSGLRNRLLELIAAEAELAKEGKPAAIWAKMNSLLDPKIIDALYAASQAGVVVNLVIRGICSLRPGVKGLSENITVKSIVGRFLEHSRICVFGNGHALPSPQAKLFISSADWMPRNFDGRVEVLVPITNPTVHAQILGQIMVANMKDEKQSWLLQPDGRYKRLPHDESGFSAHEYFMKNPSLSGRGKALAKTQTVNEELYQLKKS